MFTENGWSCDTILSFDDTKKVLAQLGFIKATSLTDQKLFNEICHQLSTPTEGDQDPTILLSNLRATILAIMNLEPTSTNRSAHQSASKSHTLYNREAREVTSDSVALSDISSNAGGLVGDPNNSTLNLNSTGFGRKGEQYKLKFNPDGKLVMGLRDQQWLCKHFTLFAMNR